MGKKSHPVAFPLKCFLVNREAYNDPLERTSVGSFPSDASGSKWRFSSGSRNFNKNKSWWWLMVTGWGCIQGNSWVGLSPLQKNIPNKAGVFWWFVFCSPNRSLPTWCWRNQAKHDPMALSSIWTHRRRWIGPLRGWKGSYSIQTTSCTVSIGMDL